MATPSYRALFSFEGHTYPVVAFQYSLSSEPIGESGYDYIALEWIPMELTLWAAEEPAVFRVWADDPDIKLPGRLTIYYDEQAVKHIWFEEGECLAYHLTAGNSPDGAAGYHLVLSLRVPRTRQGSA